VPGKLEKAADPVALVVSALVGVAGALGAWERLGLGADAVAELLAGLLADRATPAIARGAQRGREAKPSLSPVHRRPDARRRDR